MRYIVAREMPGRMRVRLEGPVPENDMGALCSVLDACPDIVSAHVYPLIGSIAVTYEPVDETRSRVLDFLSSINPMGSTDTMGLDDILSAIKKAKDRLKAFGITL